jgi:hypothetical protein
MFFDFKYMSDRTRQMKVITYAIAGYFYNSRIVRGTHGHLLVVPFINTMISVMFQELSAFLEMVTSIAPSACLIDNATIDA